MRLPLANIAVFGDPITSNSSTNCRLFIYILQFSKHLRKPIGKLMLKEHFLPRHGMNEAYRLCVQTLSLKRGSASFFKGSMTAAVDGIAQKRMTYTRHMHSYLMGATRLKPQFNVSKTAESPKHTVVSNRLAPSLNHRHLLAIGGAASDGSVYRPRIVFGAADGYSVINSVRLMLLQL